MAKPLSAFYKRARSKDGLHYYRKACLAGVHGVLRAAKCVGYRKRWYEKSPRGALGRSWYSALKRFPDSDITIDHLMQLWNQQQGRCALSGLPMVWGAVNGVAKPDAVSLDRVDWSKSYMCGNVRLICNAINAFRGRMTDAEMLAMAAAMLAHCDTADQARAA